MTEAPITEAVLQQYVDGRLPRDREAAISEWLAQHPDDEARIEAYRIQRNALRAALVPIAAEPLPAELDLHLHPRPRRLPARYMMIAASAALVFLAGGGSGWLLRDRTAPATVGTAALAREAVASYSVYASDVDRPVELAAANQEQLDQWFSRRLSRPIMAPDLGAAGFRLIGGRLIATDHGPAGLYLYRDPDGGRIALYIRPMHIQGTDHMTKREEGTVRGWTWADDGLGFGVFGEISGQRLHGTADMVRAQFSRT